MAKNNKSSSKLESKELESTSPISQNRALEIPTTKALEKTEPSPVEAVSASTPVGELNMPVHSEDQSQAELDSPHKANAAVTDQMEEDGGSSGINRKLVFLLSVLIVLGALIFVTILFLRPKIKSLVSPQATQPTSVPTSTDESTSSGLKTTKPSEEATEAAELKVNLTDYSLQILNGSGVPGEAGRLQDLLKAEGFVKIEIGNAEVYDYKDTEVGMKAKVSDEVFVLIKKALEEFAVTKVATLSDTAKYDVQIIVGQVVK